MTKQIRGALMAAFVAVVLVTTATAAGKRKAQTGPVAGEDEYRSAAGYHAAAMEHCKEVNKLARGLGAFNLELAREHAAEVTRNLAAANKHMVGYLTALSAEQKGKVTEQSAVADTKRAESDRMASELGEALRQPTPDRKSVANAATSLYLAERELVAAHKLAGKALGISAASAPRKPRPGSSGQGSARKRSTKPGGEVSKVTGAS